MSGGWNDFLALVDPARLAAASDTAAAEREATTRFETAYAAYCAENARLMAATHRAVDDFRPAGADWRALTDQMQQWLAACTTFDAVADRLQAAGRPALATRLAAVTADTARARAIALATAATVATGEAAVTTIARGAVDDATATLGRLDTAAKKAFATGNRAWDRQH